MALVAILVSLTVVSLLTLLHLVTRLEGLFILLLVTLGS